MGYGGYHPYPRRFGGGKPQLEYIHDSLNAQRGTAFNPQPTSLVWLENMAIARALCFDGWGASERLSLQWDPYRVTDMLSRWERIFGIPFNPALDDVTRRKAIAVKWESFGKNATHARMLTALKAALGDYFVAIEYLSPDVAVVHVPDGTYPWGTVVAGFPWYSTVAHILILMQKPAGASEADFYAKAGLVHQILDPIVPAWVTYDWYRAPATGSPVTVVGGPSQAGFYLDNDHNLDNSVFDV